MRNIGYLLATVFMMMLGPVVVGLLEGCLFTAIVVGLVCTALVLFVIDHMANVQPAPVQEYERGPDPIGA